MIVSDRELFKQMIERDILNLYNLLPSITSNLGINISPYLSIFENKIFNYLDLGIESFLDMLFGKDNSADIDEVADIAKMIVNEKIEQYRKAVREAKLNNIENEENKE